MLSTNWVTKKLFEEITFLGGVLFYSLFSLLFLFNKDYYLFFILVFNLIFIYAAAIIIRTFYFKSRPKKMKYHSFIRKIDASSFPSIHAARATVLFLFILFNFLNNLLLLCLSFVLTLSILYSRIYLKKHDPTDIVGGVLLGIFSFFVSYII